MKDSYQARIDKNYRDGFRQEEETGMTTNGKDTTYTITLDGTEIKLMSAILLLASLDDAGALREDARAIAAGLYHKLTKVRLGLGGEPV